jgi:hypothetical protein
MTYSFLYWRYKTKYSVFEINKETLEEAIICFLSKDLSSVWDIDYEVMVIKDDGTYEYVRIDCDVDYDNKWTINGLSRFSKLK